MAELPEETQPELNPAQTAINEQLGALVTQASATNEVDHMVVTLGHLLLHALGAQDVSQEAKRHVIFDVVLGQREAVRAALQIVDEQVPTEEERPQYLN